MKVEIEEKKRSEWKYPYIGISNFNTIVLFTSHEAGVVLDPGTSAWHVGHVIDNWDETRFKIFLGKITLNNDL